MQKYEIRSCLRGHASSSSTLSTGVRNCTSFDLYVIYLECSGLSLYMETTEKCPVKVKFATQTANVSSGEARFFFGTWGKSQWLPVTEIINFKQVTIIN